MKIYSPCIITSRLLPGIKFGDVTISIDDEGYSGDGRTIYTLYFDGPEFEIEENSLRSGCGCGGGSLQDGLESALSFLDSFATAWDYYPDGLGEMCDLFDRRLAKWAVENQDEIAILAYDLEEGNLTVIEE